MSVRVRLRFDFADHKGHVAPLTLEGPSRVIEAWKVEDVGAAMMAAEVARAEGNVVAGFVAYEAAPAFDAALTTKAPGALPLVWFGVFAGPAGGRPFPDDEESAVTSHGPTADWSADVTRPEYDAAIASVRAAIEAGDSYQANYTFRLQSRLDVPSLASRYRRLLAAHRAPYAAWLDIGRWQILSLSPELFFRRTGDRLTTRPMKGTIGRGRFDTEDDARARALQASPKNRAENVMIVDLMRNDLGRVADVGSIAAQSLFDIERYPSVFQMTSTVTGRLSPGTSTPDIFAALFPAGSITGAPKTSSMRLIAGLERAPRGVYCGAIGVLHPNGDATFSVAIRTAVVDTSTGSVQYGVGGGITWDSTPGSEYAEALMKAGFLDVPPVFSLIETMRLDHGRFVRRDRHLRRLERSARYFGIALDPDRATAALDHHASTHWTGTHRARLLLSHDGLPTVESRPFVAAALDGPRLSVALADSPVSSQDRFLFHKTTNRAVYEQHRAAHPDAFDVLLWNERGELTEFTVGNLVVEIDGRCWTPPVECGLLAGVFREELVDTGRIGERVLTRDNLHEATRVWLVNSLREWVEVTC
jgi:para-aminobenzoate synthetase/4-amino-4-deoxychorismate lyase